MILELIERLTREAASRELNFLIIGGHAIIHHGYVRMTLDIDFLAPEAERERWREMMEKFRYQPYNETAAFSQYSSSTAGWPRVDIMYVNQATWEKLRAKAVRKTGERTEALIPAPEHLVALKLHSARSASRDTPEKDWTDIEQLMRLHKLDPGDPAFADLVREHGGEESLARLQKTWQAWRSSKS